LIGGRLQDHAFGGTNRLVCGKADRLSHPEIILRPVDLALKAKAFK
jgi:hypothetical protein